MRFYEKFERFLSEYEEYERHALKPTYNEIKKYLNQLEDPDYWGKYTRKSVVANPSPVRTTFIRIKRPEMVVDKIMRRPDQFPEGLSPSSFHKMHDTIGVRVVVYYLSQLPLIERDLRGSDPGIIEISKDDPPEGYLSMDLMRRLGLTHIAHKEKESGYSSIHYTARLAESSVPKEIRPFFEIQMRTLAQELWSELEHVLAYKLDSRTNYSAIRRFNILSKELNAVDEHFNLLYEELIHNQEMARYEDADVLTSENLPAVLKGIGVQCSFKNLRGILKLLASRGITTVGNLLELGTPRRLETIRNTYLSSTGHTPGSFEIISTLASLKGSKPSSEIRRINAHIKYGMSWSVFARELGQSDSDQE